MVDEAATFPKVLRRFERWLKKYGLSNSGNGRTFAIVADGEWSQKLLEDFLYSNSMVSFNFHSFLVGSFDMGHFLYKQTLVSFSLTPPLLDFLYATSFHCLVYGL